MLPGGGQYGVHGLADGCGELRGGERTPAFGIPRADESQARSKMRGATSEHAKELFECVAVGRGRVAALL